MYSVSSCWDEGITDVNERTVLRDVKVGKNKVGYGTV